MSRGAMLSIGVGAAAAAFIGLLGDLGIIDKPLLWSVFVGLLAMLATAALIDAHNGVEHTPFRWTMVESATLGLLVPVVAPFWFSLLFLLFFACAGIYAGFQALHSYRLAGFHLMRAYDALATEQVMPPLALIFPGEYHDSDCAKVRTRRELLQAGKPENKKQMQAMLAKCAPCDCGGRHAP